MHKPESVRENKAHKILCDFEIQTDHLIPVRRLDLVIINHKNNKENLPSSGFWRSGGPWSKILKLCQRTKKTVEHEDDSHSNCSGCHQNSLQKLEKELEELEIKGKMETIQSTALLRLARILRRVLEIKGDLVTQAPMKDHLLMLRWTNTPRANNNNNNNNILLFERNYLSSFKSIKPSCWFLLHTSWDPPSEHIPILRSNK